MSLSTTFLHQILTQKNLSRQRLRATAPYDSLAMQLLLKAFYRIEEIVQNKAKILWEVTENAVSALPQTMQHPQVSCVYDAAYPHSFCKTHKQIRKSKKHTPYCNFSVLLNRECNNNQGSSSDRHDHCCTPRGKICKNKAKRSNFRQQLY